jgi:hypothetical protein
MWSPFVPRFFYFLSATCGAHRRLKLSSCRTTCGIIADLNRCGVHCQLILIIYSGIVCHLRRSSPTSFVISQDDLRRHRQLDLYSGIGCHLSHRLVGQLVAVLCRLGSSSCRTTCGIIIANFNRPLVGQLIAAAAVIRRHHHRFALTGACGISPSSPIFIGVCGRHMTICFCGPVAPAAGTEGLFIADVCASYLATAHFGCSAIYHPLIVGRLAASSLPT